MATRKRLSIIGAGPIGLELALAILDSKDHDFEITMYDKGEIAGNVQSWGHVRLFSPNELNISQLGKQIVGDTLNPEEFLTGNQFRDAYLLPLANHLTQNGVQIETQTEVLSIARQHYGKGLIDGSKRANDGFRILLSSPKGVESYDFADYVIDVSGNYGSGKFAKHIGPGGIKCIGECEVDESSAFFRTIPDILGKHREIFTSPKGKSSVDICIIGNGYSAITSLNGIKELAKQQPEIQYNVSWITRVASKDSPYIRLENDPLPQRDTLCAFGNDLADNNISALPSNLQVNYYSDCSVLSIKMDASGFILSLENGSGEITNDVHVDVTVANVGYKPDMSILDELQVHICWASQGPMKLAAALLASSGGGGGDCLAQVVPGPDTLKNPEPNFYIIGSKSYGRGSAFLLKVGLEQIENVLTLIKS